MGCDMKHIDGNNIQYTDEELFWINAAESNELTPVENEEEAKTALQRFAAKTSRQPLVTSHVFSPCPNHQTRYNRSP